MLDKKILGALGVALSCQGAAAATVAIYANAAEVHANDMQQSLSNSFGGTTIPTSQLLSITTSSGLASASNQIDYSAASGQTVLSNTLGLSRSGAQGGYGQAYDNGLAFTVSANTFYAMSGTLAFDDLGAGSGTSVLSAYLRDEDTLVDLFLSTQVSKATADASFSLGGLAGDFGNTLSGSASGALLAGHHYRWFFNAYTQAESHDDGGATAAGSLTLRIGDDVIGSGVPEPGSLALVLAAGLGALAARRRRQDA